MDKYNVKTRANTSNNMRLESAGTKATFLQNKTMFDNLKNSRKINLFEQSGLLNEDNIREEIE